MNRLESMLFSYFTHWVMIKSELREGMINNEPIEAYSEQFKTLDQIIEELMPIMEYIKERQPFFYESIRLYIESREKDRMTKNNEE